MLSVVVKYSVQKLHHSLQIQEHSRRTCLPMQRTGRIWPRAMHGHLNLVVVTILSLWI